MEGPVLMECYEDVFEEIAAKFYSDEPLSKSLPPSEHFMMASRFGSRLRSGGAMPLTLHPPPQYLGLGLPPTAALSSIPNENLTCVTNGNLQPFKTEPTNNANTDGGTANERSNGNSVARLSNRRIKTSSCGNSGSSVGGGCSSDTNSSDGRGATHAVNGQEESWVESRESLSWSSSKVARYNPNSKMYRCVDCETVGFLSRIAEHWLGAHANLKVFRCPRCPYSSAWARCVRMHLTRHHNEQHSDASLWRDNSALEEVTRFLQNLRSSVESKDDGSGSSSSSSNNGSSGGNTTALEPLSDKRYTCPQCPYATDRRDLYTRHENIHKDDKPFHCYVCYKMFSRADHVKKHFFRMHKDRPYDINLIRRHPSKGTPPSQGNIASSNGTTGTTTATPTGGSRNGGTTGGGGSGNGSNGGNPPAPAPPPPPSSTLTPYYNHSLPTLTPLPQAVMNSFSISNGLQGCPDRSSSPEMDERYSSSSKKKRLPKMFTCTYCSWRGVDNWCLKRHLNTHIKPYLCVLCDYKAARAERLSTHVLKIHNKRICNKCSFLAEDQSQLNRHIRETHHDRILVKCDDCPETFESQSDFETHGILVHNRDLLDCDFCDYKTTHAGNLEKHLTERHSLTEDGEIRLPNGELCHRDFHCRVCGCEFANYTSLQTHTLLLHRTDRSPGRLLAYSCSLCHFACASQTIMMEHMRVHTGEVLQCQAEQCAFRTPYDAVLREHVLYVHNDDFTIRCPHCGLAASTWANVGRHFPSHHARPCTACLAVIRKHFPGKNLGSSDQKGNTNIDEMKVFHDGPPALVTQVDFQVITQVKRQRKQSQPRKIIQTSDDEEDDEEEDIEEHSTHKSTSHSRQTKWFSACLPSSRSRKLCSIRWQALRPPPYRCRQCVSPVGFILRKSLLLHSMWRHTRKQFTCEHCSLSYKHQYQVLLHASRSHVEPRHRHL